MTCLKNMARQRLGGNNVVGKTEAGLCCREHGMSSKMDPGLNLDSATHDFVALGRMLHLSETNILTCKIEMIIIPS